MNPPEKVDIYIAVHAVSKRDVTRPPGPFSHQRCTPARRSSSIDGEEQGGQAVVLPSPPPTLRRLLRCSSHRTKDSSAIASTRPTRINAKDVVFRAIFGGRCWVVAVCGGEGVESRGVAMRWVWRVWQWR